MFEPGWVVFIHYDGFELRSSLVLENAHGDPVVLHQEKAFFEPTSQPVGLVKSEWLRENVVEARGVHSGHIEGMGRGSEGLTQFGNGGSFASVVVTSIVSSRLILLFFALIEVVSLRIFEFFVEQLAIAHMLLCLVVGVSVWVLPRKRLE